MARTRFSGDQSNLQLISVKDYGAVGDGVTDDTSAIQAAIDYATGRAALKIFFPAGDYYISSGLTLPPTGVGDAGVTLTGEDAAMFGLASAITGSRIITDKAIDMITVGSSTTTVWLGPVIEDITFVDTSESNDQVTAAIHVRRANMGIINNCNFQSIKNGAGIKTTGTGGNPQYWTVRDCRWYDVKFGVQQTSTSADWTFFGGTYWGVNVGSAHISGSIGFDIQGTCKLYGTHIQYCETGIKFTNAPVSKMIGCALESESGISGVNAIEIVSGDGISIVNTDVVGPYSTAKLNIASGVNRTFVTGFDDNGGGGTIVDNGTNTTILDADPARSNKISGALAISGELTLSDATTNLSSGLKIVVTGANPEGAITAPVGSLALRTTGGAGFSFYVKESGTGNTGWAAK